MRIPNKLKIGGRIFDVREVVGLVDNGNFKESGHNTILLDAELNQESRELAFFHEVLHSLNNQLDDRDVEWMAQGIYQVLKDNNLLK